jgi:hemoglobin
MSLKSCFCGPQVGGQGVCRQLSEAFYARVERDPVLRPLFPGKSMRCAVGAFTAFLAQFLGGPAEDAQGRWWLSLRESHLRFKIGSRERQAWMSNMIEALEDVPIDQPVRLALPDLFERSSAYIVNTGQGLREPAAPKDPSDNRIHREIAQRWRWGCFAARLAPRGCAPVSRVSSGFCAGRQGRRSALIDRKARHRARRRR